MLDRRRFLKAGAAAAATVGLAACGTSSTTTTTTTLPRRRTPSRLAFAESARTLEENARQGSTEWAKVGGTPSGALEGFFDRTSAAPGEVATLYVRTTRAFRVEAYRMGYYGGTGARLVSSTRRLRAQAQPAPAVDASLGTVSCAWNPTWRFDIDDSFPPGSYLFRLVADNGWTQWVPLTVRDTTPRARFMIVNSVTTWQAYNPWGGWSLYAGETGRADVVSFDRPYALGLGQSNFLFNELPLIFQMEGLGLDVSYWTDIDLHQRGSELASSTCMLSLGHDEYWSWQMRESAIRAQAAGVNLAFLGANFCYRQIRLEPSGLGADRLMVNYRSTADPIYAVDPRLTTVNWSDPPVGLPESQFTGSIYDGFEGPAASWDLVVEDASSWLWRGTGVHDGTRLRDLERNETNRFDPSAPDASRVQILGHSPTAGGMWSDVTYLSVASGAGVLCTGTSTWIYAMQNGRVQPPTVMAAPVPGVTDVVLRAMENLYALFGAGPAGRAEPSQPNTARFY